MERKLTQEEFVQLFALQQQKTKKARRNIDRQDKTKGYNDFYRQDNHYGIRHSQIINL